MTNPLRRIVALTACLLLTACEDERLLLGERVAVRDAEADDGGERTVLNVGGEDLVLNVPGHDTELPGVPVNDSDEPPTNGANDGDCYELPQPRLSMCAGSTVWQRRISPRVERGDLRADTKGNAYLLINAFGDATINGATIDGSPAVPPGESSPLSAKLLRFTADGEHDWTLTLSGFSPGSATYGRALAVSDDRICVAGSGKLPSSFRLASSDTESSNFIACTDTSGQPLWARRLASVDMVLDDIALDSSNRVFVTGYFYQNVDLGGSVRATAETNERQQVLMSFGANGEPRWLHTLPGLSPAMHPRVLVLDDDRIAYTGQIAGASDFAGLAIDDPFAGSSDGETMAALIVELDSDGNAKWATSYLSEYDGDAAFSSIAQAPGGRIVAVTESDGMFEGVHLYDRSGERLASYRASGDTLGASFVASRSGGFVVGARCSPLDTITGACMFELDENLEAKNLHYFAPFEDSNSVVGLAVDAQQAVLMVIENHHADALDLRRFVAR